MIEVQKPRDSYPEKKLGKLHHSIKVKAGETPPQYQSQSQSRITYPDGRK